MIALRITNTKDFMAKLLTQETFDTFLFSEGSVTTFTTFSIDGSWHPVEAGIRTFSESRKKQKSRIHLRIHISVSIRASS